MEIIFDPPTLVTIVPEVKKTLGSIMVTHMIDYPEEKMVVAQTVELGTVVLWQGAEYDAIGQWTDQDVIDRIKELYVV